MIALVLLNNLTLDLKTNMIVLILFSAQAGQREYGQGNIMGVDGKTGDCTDPFNKKVDEVVDVSEVEDMDKDVDKDVDKEEIVDFDLREWMERVWLVHKEGAHQGEKSSVGAR